MWSQKWSQPVANGYEQINGDQIYFPNTGILVRLLAGLGIGFVVKQVWGRLLKIG
jgi:hypothetical protein